ncbi:MAG: hypothetical protein O2794_00515 [bacterium]|nr:hypothetical protein [bacterium]
MIITGPTHARELLYEKGYTDQKIRIAVKTALAHTAVMKKEFFQCHEAKETIRTILDRTQHPGK